MAIDQVKGGTPVPTLCSALQGPQGLGGIAGVLGAPGEKVRCVFLCH